MRDLDALGLTADDVVVVTSASGRTPYVLSAIREARRRSTTTVSVACHAGSAAGRRADNAIDVVVGPEFIAGSTCLKAGTAQKLVLNMLVQKKVRNRRRLRPTRHQLRLAIARESRPPTTKPRQST